VALAGDGSIFPARSALPTGPSRLCICRSFRLYDVYGYLNLVTWHRIINRVVSSKCHPYANDFDRSYTLASFKLISIYSLPIMPTERATIVSSPSLHVYQSPYHDPLLLFITLDPKTLCMLNVTHLSPRKPLPFPRDEGVVVEMTRRMRLDDDDDDDDDGNDNGRSDRQNNNHAPPRIGGWTIGIGGNGQARSSDENDKLEACAMGLEGRIIVGVGSRGTVWLWTKGKL
jgi:polycomb protein EED